MAELLCDIISPNFITTLGFLFMFPVLFYLKKGCTILPIVFYLLMFLFDCLDGSIARKCDKKTKFGAFYDIFIDFMKILLIFIFIQLITNLYCLINEISDTRSSKDNYFTSNLEEIFHDNLLITQLVTIFILTKYNKIK